MCAMLALVAPEELKVELGRTIQFVEAYVGEWARSRLPTTVESFPLDTLVRYRLHACAAYLRKYSRVDEVQKTTRVRSLNRAHEPSHSQPKQLETIIYTACRKCRKPVVAVRSRNPFVKATHAVCATCKEAVVRCSIWCVVLDCVWAGVC